jgi:hypothetical protein
VSFSVVFVNLGLCQISGIASYQTTNLLMRRNFWRNIGRGRIRKRGWNHIVYLEVVWEFQESLECISQGWICFLNPLNTILPPETICPIYSPKKTTSISHKITLQTSPSLGTFHVDSVLDSFWRVKGDFIPCINRLSTYPVNTKRHKGNKRKMQLHSPCLHKLARSLLLVNNVGMRTIAIPTQRCWPGTQNDRGAGPRGDARASILRSIEIGDE